MSVNRDNHLKLKEDIIWITRMCLCGEFDYSVWINLYIYEFLYVIFTCVSLLVPCEVVYVSLV